MKEEPWPDPGTQMSLNSPAETKWPGRGSQVPPGLKLGATLKGRPALPLSCLETQHCPSHPNPDLPLQPIMTGWDQSRGSFQGSSSEYKS